MMGLKKELSLRSRKQEALDEQAELEDLRQATEFEKGDFTAILIAAVITLLPVVVLVLLAYYLISMFFFA